MEHPNRYVGIIIIEFETGLIQKSRHGRDNKLHVWNRVQDVAESIRSGGSATLQESSAPILTYSMDVNALNYCRFSLLPQNSSALIALPNLVESSEVSINLLWFL